MYVERLFELTPELPRYPHKPMSWMKKRSKSWTDYPFLVSGHQAGTAAAPCSGPFPVRVFIAINASARSVAPCRTTENAD